MKTAILFLSITFLPFIAFGQFNPVGNNPNDLFWNRGKVGIGLTNPTSRLDIRLNTNFMYTDKSALKITYPIPALSPNGRTINENIFEIRQATSNSIFSTKFVVKVNGNVGIGVQNNNPLLNSERLVVTDNNPSKVDLHVIGFSLIDGTNASLLLGSTTGAPSGEWGLEHSGGGLNFWKPFGSNNFGNHFLFIKDNGNVGIGTNNPEGYKLAVKGRMIAEEVVVKLHGNWPDYVFGNAYDLMDLTEVEKYIEDNNHLPDVPSAKETEESGINLGEMDAILLRKIEELTLYVIELKKENVEQQKVINQLTKEN